jgi:predicted methyltransferase
MTPLASRQRRQPRYQSQRLRPGTARLGLLLLTLLTVTACSGGSAPPPVERPAALEAAGGALPVIAREPSNVMSFEAADWLERPGRVEAERPDEVIATLGLQPGDVVADVGCGTGFFTRRLARAVGAEGIVYAVDVQPEMLERLRANAAQAGLDNIRPLLGSQDDPQLPPGEVDWILLADVYHEMQEPAVMLARLRASLAPGGRVALLEYRLEGDTAAHIRRDHRMSPEQVLAEWEPAGFRLADLLEFLPSQHFFVFEKADDEPPRN